MKKIENILSWMAFFVIAIAICSVSIYGGACVCNYLKDLWHLTGWECLILVPMLVLVGLAICLFFMLGLKRFSIQYQQ